MKRTYGGVGDRMETATQGKAWDGRRVRIRFRSYDLYSKYYIGIRL